MISIGLHITTVHWVKIFLENSVFHSIKYNYINFIQALSKNFVSLDFKLLCVVHFGDHKGTKPGLVKLQIFKNFQKDKKSG